MATDVEICSSGLVLVGSDVITSFSGESSREKNICNALYARTRNALLSSYPWRFAHDQVELARLVDTPVFETEWDYAFQLPTDFGRITKIEGGKDFDILGDKLLCNSKTIKIEYSFVPDETDFPESFSRFLEFKLARLFAISLVDDEKKEARIEKLEAEAGVIARAIDSQGVINKGFDVGILVDVRL